MSRQSSPSRLPPRAVRTGLALCLALGLAGCSATSGGPRTGAASKAKTFLAVGDRPLPVVSGEAGSTVAADPEPAPVRNKARADGRISGRVFDADGRPVPEARVRLAVGGAPGGRVIRTSTDRSGAFTLHGLRPGSHYTVIAESDGDDGVVTGRTEARTSDTDIRISLGTAGAPASASGLRVDPVSNREPADDGAGALEDADEPPAVKGRRRPGLNEEDLPPAPEAEALAPTESNSPRSRPGTSTRRGRAAGSGGDPWKRGTGDPGPAPPAADRGGSAGHPAPEAEAAPVDPEARGTAGPAPDDPEGDVPNPLPPALERPPAEAEPAAGGEGPVGLRPDSDPFAEPPTRLAARGTSPAPKTPTRPEAASSAFESPSSPTERPSAPAAMDHRPGALVVVPETFGPVVVDASDPFATGPPAGATEPAPVVERSAPARRTSPSPRPRSAPSARRASPAVSGAGSAGTGESPRRPTWGEVAASVTTMPAPEGSTEAPAGRTVADASKDRGKGAKDPLAAQCEYDERLRRIVDFRLPALDGQPLRFQEIDADLILLDFWGTWCQPCIRSVPHLVDLQERMGNKRLAVVGVACEQDSPDEATARVASTAQRLKINYPILLSRNDGSCPLQEALHVQAFPTMVLVDRRGRVLWRDQGATPATLARLDRFLAASPAASEVTRR